MGRAGDQRSSATQQVGDAEHALADRRAGAPARRDDVTDPYHSDHDRGVGPTSYHVSGADQAADAVNVGVQVGDVL
jgi:hypothetical protein